MRILTFTQAGKLDGLGHLKRSRIIKDMIDKDFNLINYLYVLLDSYDNIFFNNFNERSIGNNFDEIVALIHTLKPTLIIIDLNYKNLNFRIKDLIVFIKKLNIKILAIDGLIDFLEYIDLIFFPSFFPSVMNNYLSIDKIVSGWDCYLLDEKFFKPKRWEDGNNLLVMTGGSDVLNLNKIWPKYINEKLSKDMNIHWIVGPYAQKPDFNFKKNMNFITYFNPSNIYDICKKINYAITLYGVSFFELIAQGIPTVVLPLNLNRDKDELHYLSKNKIAITAENYCDATDKFSVLKSNNNLSRILNKKCNHLISDPGIKRLKLEIKKLLDLE